MASSSEVGACKVNVDSYKCSIKKITVSTKWKAPTGEVSETVTTTVYDNQSAKWGKNIYLVTSPKGKSVTVKTERDDGKCPRDNHKKYVLSSGKSDTLQTPVISTSLTPAKAISTNNSKDADSKNTQKKEAIKAEEVITIKCYEIDCIKESFKYIKFPIPTLKSYSSQFKYVSCKEGNIQYKIIPYPDISFKLEFSVGTEAKKNRNKTSKFEKKTSALKNVSSQLKDINSNSLDVELKFSPSFTASATCNGGDDEIELTINFDKEKEIVHAKFKHDSNEIELGSEFIQDFSNNVKKYTDFIKLLVKLCKLDFLKDFMQFDATSLTKSYKPYKLKLASPNILLSLDGKYQTSKDLTRIGKLIDFGIACEPLIQISFTVDLLYLILTAASAGTATGFYVMLKNLDKVIGKILGDDYKKKYKDTKPFEADVYFNFIITGAINGSIHWIIDTSEEKGKTKYNNNEIEGVLKVDLEAGAKCSLDFFFVAVEGEASASGTTGIKLKLALENYYNQGDLIGILEGVFLGIKIKYCVKGKVGLMKTASYGGSLVDGEAKLLDETKLFSLKW